MQELGRILFDALLARGGAAPCSPRPSTVPPRRSGNCGSCCASGRLNWPGCPGSSCFDAGEGRLRLSRHARWSGPQVAAPQRPLRVAAPLRMLCMAARPDDLEPLALEAGAGTAAAASWRAGAGRAGRTGLGRPGRPGATCDRDARAGEGPWHVFHFIGHGGFDALAQEGTRPSPTRTGGTYHLGAENLTMVLESMPSLRLVVLNACETGPVQRPTRSRVSRAR